MQEVQTSGLFNGNANPHLMLLRVIQIPQVAKLMWQDEVWPFIVTMSMSCFLKIPSQYFVGATVAIQQVALTYNETIPWWLRRFWRQHPNLTLRTPQLLLCCRALCSDQEAVNEFFGKLGALKIRLILISKPIQLGWNWHKCGTQAWEGGGRMLAL